MNLAIQMKMIDTFSTAYVKSAFLLLFLNRRYKMEFTSKITVFVDGHVSCCYDMLIFCFQSVINLNFLYGH